VTAVTAPNSVYDSAANHDAASGRMTALTLMRP
jgi:hypothetical protein